MRQGAILGGGGAVLGMCRGEGSDFHALSPLPCILGRVRNGKDELAQALGPETKGHV